MKNIQSSFMENASQKNYIFFSKYCFKCCICISFKSLYRRNLNLGHFTTFESSPGLPFLPNKSSQNKQGDQDKNIYWPGKIYALTAFNIHKTALGGHPPTSGKTITALVIEAFHLKSPIFWGFLHQVSLIIFFANML